MPIPTQRITVEAGLELSSHTSPHATRCQGCSFSTVSLPWALGARTQLWTQQMQATTCPQLLR